jgi:hypothetical protein
MFLKVDLAIRVFLQNKKIAIKSSVKKWQKLLKKVEK